MRLGAPEDEREVGGGEEPLTRAAAWRRVFNAGKGWGLTGFAGVLPVEQRPPGLELGPKGYKVDPAARLAAGLEFSKTLFEQRAKSRRVPARVMVEGRSDLNQAVEKDLFVAHGLEPHSFQGFVSFEKFPGVEQPNTFNDARIHKLIVPFDATRGNKLGPVRLLELRMSLADYTATRSKNSVPIRTDGT